MDPRYPLLFDSTISSHVSENSMQSSLPGKQQKAEQFQTIVASSLNIPSSNVACASTNSTSFTNLGSNDERSSLSGVSSAVLKGSNMHINARAAIDHLNPVSVAFFGSHKSSILGSPTTSDSSILQRDSRICQSRCHTLKRKVQQGGTGTLSGLGNAQTSLDNTQKVGLSISNDMHGSPRLDIKQDDVVHQLVVQQLLQSQVHKQPQGHVQVLEAFINQHKLENQKILQSVQEMQEADSKKQRQQQIQDYLQQLASQDGHHIHLLNGNICTRQLMQYLYHLQHHPPDNGITYWRKFVAEYYAPSAKKRWCFSQCGDFTLHAARIFPLTTMDTWKCELCRAKHGRGFEATFEMLPRLNKLQFESGVINELLFLDFPRECTLPSGLMMLEYDRAAHETVFEQLHVVREGKLRVVFTPDLKMLSWEFCSRKVEELLPRNSIASQVNEFLHAARELQTNIDGRGSDKISLKKLEEKYNMLMSIGCKLQRNFDCELVGESGFSKQHTRCLQIADVLNCMKDLMTFSQANKIGPIESLKRYSQNSTSIFNYEYQEKEKHETSQGMPRESTRLSSTSCGMNNNKSENSITSMDGLLTSSEKNPPMCAGDYYKLPRQMSIGSNASESVESSPLYTGANQCAFRSSMTLNPNCTLNMPLSSSHFLDANSTQEERIQKLLQEMVSNSRAANQSEQEQVDRIQNNVSASLSTNFQGTGSTGRVFTFDCKKNGKMSGNNGTMATFDGETSEHCSFW